MSDPPKSRVSIPPLTDDEREHGAHDDRPGHQHAKPVHREIHAPRGRAVNPSARLHPNIDPALLEAERHDDVPDPDFIKSDVTRFNPMIAIGVAVICVVVLLTILMLAF
ncbi:MAG TPA: hypothetical protein PK402_10700 [Tepidisphaeraceae bacterium]|nr:hypothetical protein [Tepidisphaeraceae bacterium]